MMTMKGNLIDKERIIDFKFEKAHSIDSKKWEERLAYAVRLGNEFKGKTLLIINTNDGPKAIETTVWSLTNQHLQIKGGILIPLQSIEYVAN